MLWEWLLKKVGKRSSIFKVILWINICSITALAIFYYYVFNRMGGKAYKESFVSYNQRVLDLAFDNIDKQVIQSALLLGQLNFPVLGEESLLLRPQSEQVTRESEVTVAIAKEMRRIQRAYPYVAGFDIYYEATGTIVTGFDKVHVSADAETVKRYLPWYGEYVKGGRKSGFRLESEGAYLVDGPTVTYIKKIPRSKWEGKDVVLATHILPSSFAEYIDVESGNLTIVDNNNQFLYTTEPEDLPLFDKQDLGALREKDTPLFLKSKEQPVTVFRKGSPTSGLMYLYSIRDTVFYKDYSTISRMFLINFLISIGFNVMVLVMISIYNYKTYHNRILAVSKNAGIDIGTSKHNFDDSLTMLSSKIATLDEAVNSSKGLLFQNSVRSVIMNRNKGGGYDVLSPYLTNDSVCTFFINVPGKDLMHVSVEKLQDEFPAEEGRYHVLFTIVEKDGLVAILNLEHNKIAEDTADFINNMKQRFSGCFLAYGKVYPNQKDGLKNSYESTVEIFRYHYIFPELQVLCGDELNPKGRKESGSHLKLFEAMDKDMKSENLLEFKTHMEFLITSFKCGAYGIDYCKSTLRDLVTWMYQVIQHNQLDMWVIFGYDIREYYLRIPNIDMFCCWMNELCEVILKNVRQRKKDVSSDVRSRVISMIDEHLEDNISLDYIAEQLNIRPDAASRLFRQMMGCGYTEYVKEKKLSRAIQFLEQDYSVKDIAEKLGYSSAQYFIKVFKEDQGITPHQYKKSKTKEP